MPCFCVRCFALLGFAFALHRLAVPIGRLQINDDDYADNDDYADDESYGSLGRLPTNSP